jgi:hypothetical protein
MSRKNGFLAIRIVLALCVVLACILWAAAQYAGGEGRTVTGPEDLRVELQWAQLLASPGAEDTFAYDAGGFVFVPDGGADAAALAGGLVPLTGEGGGTVWPVTLFEDPVTRETVFMNADGEEFGRLPPPDGYDPGWIASVLYPEGAPSAAAAAACDPSRIVMTVLLLPLGAAAEVTGTRHAESPASGKGVGGIDDPAAGLICGGTIPVAGAGSGAAAQSDVEAAAMAARERTTAGTTNAPSTRARGGHARAKHTVYVDRSIGKDAWTGRVRDKENADDGPKRTVGAGLGAVNKGDRLVINRGAYAENLDVRGKDADVLFSGNVVLSKASGRPAGSGSAVPVQIFTGPTGTVTRVTN